MIFSNALSKKILLCGLLLNGFFLAETLPSKAETTLPSIWDNFDVSNPSLPVKDSNQQAQTTTLKTNTKVQKPTNQQATFPSPSPKAPVQQADRLSAPQKATTDGQFVLPPKPKASPKEILQELKDPNYKPSSGGFLGGENDPAGQDLEKTLPLDKPLSERFAEDILDPIELDVDDPNVLSLSLEKALVIGLGNNLPQRIIDETVIRDKWRFWTTTSGLLPDAFGSYTFSDQAPGISFFPGVTNQVNVGAQYNLAPSEVFSTIASYYDWMANTQFQGSNLQDLMRNVTNQYYEVMRARGELAVRIEAVKQAKIQLGLNEKLDEAGVGTRFAVLQAREQLAENELALLAQQSISRIAELQLLTTLYLPLGTDIRLEEKQISRKTLISPEYQITELVDMALTNRPDIRRRQFAFKAARKRIGETVMNSFAPALSATASLTRVERDFGRSFELFEKPGDYQSIQVSLTMPFITGLGLGQLAPINERRAISRQTGLELENEILQVEGQVRDAFLRSQSAEKQIAVSERQLAASTEGIKLARIRLQNGVGTNIDLIDTQRNYVNALVNKVRAIVDYNQSQVDILRAIGLITVSDILDRSFSIKEGDNSLEVEEEEEDPFQQAGYSSNSV
jgi:OMF family outer membrane factor